MNKQIDERPVFPFTSIVGQEEICEMRIKLFTINSKCLIMKIIKLKARRNLTKY